MLAVPQQADAEESVVEYIIWHHHFPLLPLYVGSMLHLQGERLAVVNRLRWLALPVQPYACKERGMSIYHYFFEKRKKTVNIFLFLHG